VCTDR
jgi:hypothetical protein